MSISRASMTRAAGFALACLALVFAASAPAETRVALVIGDSAYLNVPRLPNPVADASLVAGALRQAGFTSVTVRTDLNQTELRRALQMFSAAARGADVAVIYFAGHGMEMNGTNYLIPVDARLESDGDVSFEAVPLDLVQEAVRARRLGIVILDACRNNPFAAQMNISSGARRAVTRGLARVEPADNTLVVYAAREGTTALDGAGDSPFAKALATRLPTPGLEVELLFRRVRDDVMTATGSRQQPFTYGSLSGDPFYFVPGGAPGAPLPPAAAPIQLANLTPPRPPASQRYPGIPAQMLSNVDSAERIEPQARAKAAEAAAQKARVDDAAAKARDAARRAGAGESGYAVLTEAQPNGGMSRYAGQVANGVANGYGVRTSPDVVRQEGEWKSGQPDGLISETLRDGSRFDGRYMDGHIDGLMVVTLAGGVFQGEMRQTDAHVTQLGVYTPAPGGAVREQVGQFQDGFLTGFGIQAEGDGNTVKGFWSKDEAVGVKFRADGRPIAQGFFSVAN